MNDIWQVNAADFPDRGTMDEKIKFWLRYAILAPSAHNIQPWEFTIGDRSLTVNVSRSYRLSVSDPTLRETILSIAAFIENFIIVANYWGYKVEINQPMISVNDACVARLLIRKSKRAPLAKLGPSEIANRHTNRGPYDPNPLHQRIKDEIASLSESGVKLFIITDPAARARVADLVGQGMQIGLSLSSMRQELAELVWRENDRRTTGMSLESMSAKYTNKSAGAQWVLEELDVDKEANDWRNNFASAPMHVIVASQLDGPLAWLPAGRLMERALLTAVKFGLNHCIAAGPIEIPTLWPQLRREIDKRYRPQVLIRLGRPLMASMTRHSTRRPVE